MNQIHERHRQFLKAYEALEISLYAALRNADEEEFTPGQLREKWKNAQLALIAEHFPIYGSAEFHRNLAKRLSETCSPWPASQLEKLLEEIIPVADAPDCLEAARQIMTTEIPCDQRRMAAIIRLALAGKYIEPLP